MDLIKYYWRVYGGIMGGNSYTTDLYLDLFRKKWSIYILAELFTGSKRFQDFQNNSPTISPKVLNQTLIEMEKMGLIDKTVISKKPKITEYCLTEKGYETRKFVKELLIFLTNNSNLADDLYKIEEKIELL